MLFFEGLGGSFLRMTIADAVSSFSNIFIKFKLKAMGYKPVDEKYDRQSKKAYRHRFRCRPHWHVPFNASTVPVSYTHLTLPTN